MNKTSPVWAFISAANPFSGRFQVFNFQYKDTPGCGRFLARLTHLNRISTEGNELELAVCPTSAATLTIFTKIAHVKEGIHTPCSFQNFFCVFHAGVRYIADPFSGRFQVFNFQYKDTPGCGRFLARLTHLNRISTEGNELELAVCPTSAATLTIFTKIAHVKEGIHTPCSFKNFFCVFHAGVRYIAEYPARLNAPTFL